MNAKVEELLARIVPALRKARVRYAVGGDVAVNAYGFRRETQDVDVFVAPEDKAKLSRALLRAGFRLGRLHPPWHYFAMLPGEDDLDVRVDLLFPESELELLAIADAAPGQAGAARLVPVEALVAMKGHRVGGRRRAPASGGHRGAVERGRV